MDDQPGRLTAETTRSTSTTVFLSVGEPSGDLHGAALARALRERLPGVRLIGLGGPRMAAEGVELLAGVEDLAVMGIAEVVSRLPFFLRLRRRVFRALAVEDVDLVIPIDYPGFNMRLARFASSSGIPVLYYIAPQVWAWHASRVRNLASDCARVAVILPFEEAFLRARGVAAEFVGHPLLDRPTPAGSRDEWLTEHGFRADVPLLALFPGSRRQEIDRHLPILLAAADQVREAVPSLQVAIGVAETMDPAAYAGTPYPLVGGSEDLLRNADAAIVKSGTVTLEAALAGVPFVVIYRIHPLSYRIARRLVRVPHIALANLVVGRRLVPELVQEDAKPEAIAALIIDLLNEASPDRAAIIDGLGEVRGMLSRGGASERVAELAAELLGSV